MPAFRSPATRSHPALTCARAHRPGPGPGEPRSCPAPARRPETKCKPVSTGGRVSGFGLQLPFWRRRHGAAGSRGDDGGGGGVGGSARARPRREGRRGSRAARGRALPPWAEGVAPGGCVARPRPLALGEPPRPAPPWPRGACAAASATSISWQLAG